MVVRPAKEAKINMFGTQSEKNNRFNVLHTAGKGKGIDFYISVLVV